MLDGEHLGYAEEGQGEGKVGEYALHVVGDRVIVLTDEVGEQHGCAVARNATPCTGYVAIARHEDDVDGKQHRAGDDRHDGAPVGLVVELVPEGEVEVDPHENLGHHHDGHHA